MLQAGSKLTSCSTVHCFKIPEEGRSGNSAGKGEKLTCHSLDVAYPMCMKLGLGCKPAGLRSNFEEGRKTESTESDYVRVFAYCKFDDYTETQSDPVCFRTSLRSQSGSCLWNSVPCPKLRSLLRDGSAESTTPIRKP